MDSIYITPEHEQLREQIARFIAREVEPHLGEPVVVLATAKDRAQALEIAEALVGERLAACVNVAEGLTISALNRPWKTVRKKDIFNDNRNTDRKSVV